MNPYEARRDTSLIVKRRSTIPIALSQCFPMSRLRTTGTPALIDFTFRGRCSWTALDRLIREALRHY